MTSLWSRHSSSSRALARCAVLAVERVAVLAVEKAWVRHAIVPARWRGESIVSVQLLKQHRSSPRKTSESHGGCLRAPAPGPRNHTAAVLEAYLLAGPRNHTVAPRCVVAFSEGGSSHTPR